MRSLLAGLVLLAASTLPLAAHADTVLFTLTGGGNTSTWTLPSPVTFTYSDQLAQFLPTFPITITTNGVSTSSTATFEYGHVANVIVDGLEILNIPSVLNTTFISDNGIDSTYTGTFDLGTFYGEVALFSNNTVTYVPYTLAIVDEQQTTLTPEPSSLILLATGLLAAAPTLRRRLIRHR